MNAIRYVLARFYEVRAQRAYAAYLYLSKKAEEFYFRMGGRP